MKQRITRLSPHQNGKVSGIIMAAVSAVFVVPFALVYALSGVRGDGPPAWVFVLAPIFYLIAGYIGTAIGCWIYNILVGVTGGIEYEARPEGQA